MSSGMSVRRIVLAYAINAVGGWFGLVALTIAIYDHSHSAFAVAGFFVASQAVPALFVPVLVARLETVGRTSILAGVYLVEAALCVGLIFFIVHYSFPALLALSMIDGVASLAARALTRTGAAHAGRAESELGGRAANAQLSIAFAVTLMAGPPLAGLLVGFGGSTVALGVDVVSFIVCALMLSGLSVRAERAESARSRLRAAALYLRENRPLRLLFTAQAVGLLAFMAATPVEVLYVRSTLGGSSLDYGLFIAAWGAGQVAGGAFFARRLDANLAPMLVLSTLAISCGYGGFGIAPTFLVACAFGVVGGAGNGVQWAALFSTIQELAPKEMHARLMGALESVGALCTTVGFVLGGAVANAYGPRAAMFTIAGLGLVATLLFARAVRVRVVSQPAPARSP